DRREGADAPLALQAEHALVEVPGLQHDAVHALEVLGGNAGIEGRIQVALAVQDGQVLDRELRLDDGPGHGARSHAFYPGPGVFSRPCASGFACPPPPPTWGRASTRWAWRWGSTTR